MIWAILVILGVPLWLCAIGILALVLRNRGLRRRPGNMPVRVLRAGKTRWTRGNAVWVSDVFAWRGSPAAWKEELAQVIGATVRDADAAERKALHRLGDAPAVATLTTADGSTMLAATAGEHRSSLPGPVGRSADRPLPLPQAAAGD